MTAVLVSIEGFGLLGPRTLLPFVAETYGPDAFHEAWAEFSGADCPFDPETPRIQVFEHWVSDKIRRSTG